MSRITPILAVVLFLAATTSFAQVAESTPTKDRTGAENHTIKDPGTAAKSESSNTERRVSERLRHKERAVDGDPDRPVVTGRVPNH